MTRGWGRRALWRLAWLGLLLGAGWAPVQAQTNGAVVAKAPAELVAQLQAKLAEAQTDLSRTLAMQAVATNLPPGATAGEAIEYRSHLQRLVRTYQLHLDDLAALEASGQRQQDLDRMVRSWNGFPEAPPYSILFVDGLRDSVQSFEARIKAAATTRDVTTRFIAEAQASLKETDEKLRRSGEQMEGATDPAVLARLTWQRKLDQLRNRVFGATAASFEARRQLALGDLAEHRQRLAFAQRQLALAGQHVAFPPADLERVMASLDAERAQLEQEIQTADAELEARQKVLGEAREELRRALQQPSAGSSNAAALVRLQALVEVRGTQAQTSTERLGVLRQLLDGVGNERQMWQMRFATFGSRKLAELQEGYGRLDRLSGLVEAAKPYFSQQLALAASQIAEQQQQLRNSTDPQFDAGLARERLESFEQRDEFYHRALRGLEKRERLVLRWRASLDLDRGALPFTTRVRDLFTEASAFASKLWQFELFVAQDTITVDGQSITGRRAVTVGKITMAILILVVGFWISNLVARVFERLAVRRLKVEVNQANLIRRWARVVLVIALVLFSLISVKIPLTIFAFAGGALAIGLGFGTQNLLKNFISGIIILFERPFRVGDVLDVGGQRGTVTTIGIRSCVLERWDGTETLIPNSGLLEENVTNWTYSNRAVRFVVTVGVAYGSDTRRVAQILAEVAERHGLVQKEPHPQVLFTEFGESTLNFELRYWVDVLRSNAAQIASDLRHMIAGAFAENSIVIAFPQRDLHVTAETPLPVRMVAATPKPAADPTPPAAEEVKPADL